tara:strand:- start:113 stop:241 length:129 start_codon:yes stop_codon:yes gene_type:complete
LEACSEKWVIRKIPRRIPRRRRRRRSKRRLAGKIWMAAAVAM